ncbi:hypothetical protein AAMO2058_000479900 [Amorphochlora amoebiformis]|mmetsp:Transcript_19297/g.30649  ORF Transcript_19297/g.30649 Transcript_19297/m.30649 type:complete len:420 (-) Transcript_19297:205-1464(-)
MFDVTCIDEIELYNKRVFIRVDFNVPLGRNLQVVDNRRIKSAVPTIKYALSQGARSIVLASHLGRPDGRFQDKFSLRHIKREVERCLGHEIKFLRNAVGPETEKACSSGSDGSIFLLENLRFHAEEQGKGKDAKGKKFKPSKASVATFRASLSNLADVYINDAFGTCHRAHSSITGLKLKIKAAGLLVKKEVAAFGAALEMPRRPFVAVLGGKKVKDKLPLIKNLLKVVDAVVISGGMAWTFLKTDGYQIGNSIFDQKGATLVPEIYKLAKEHSVALHLPVDAVAAQHFREDSKTKVVTMKQGIPANWMGLDIGPVSTGRFQKVIRNAKTVVYNGPQGVFEMRPFSRGTRGCLMAMAQGTWANSASTIVGGGDSAYAARKFRLDDKMSHISTGGGASLELLQGRVLPGIAFLQKKRSAL